MPLNHTTQGSLIRYPVGTGNRVFRSNVWRSVPVLDQTDSLLLTISTTFWIPAAIWVSAGASAWFSPSQPMPDS